MDTGFQHLTHGNCHENSPRGLGLKPTAASSALPRLIWLIRDRTPDTLGAPACESSLVRALLRATLAAREING
ncbi:hypothetical protein BG61_14785 [Caballeronia glathei]|uniref:Uncharacterized protein n=1 Tax=Caballeronia glathei TaxID=60547 RepID=A0A069PMU2_9BURK|nr:hypothetical protein BG61_14785 [Caballeronia glathei]